MPALQQQQDWGNADAEASEEFLGVLEKFSGTLSEAVYLSTLVRPFFPLALDSCQPEGQSGRCTVCVRPC